MKFIYLVLHLNLKQNLDIIYGCQKSLLLFNEMNMREMYEYIQVVSTKSMNDKYRLMKNYLKLDS